MLTGPLAQSWLEILHCLLTAFLRNLSFSLSCRCTLPENPSNHTLQYWKDHNIMTSEVPWANLTVTVSTVPTRFKRAFEVEVGEPALQQALVFSEIKLFL